MEKIIHIYGGWILRDTLVPKENGKAGDFIGFSKVIQKSRIPMRSLILLLLPHPAGHETVWIHLFSYTTFSPNKTI